MTGCAPATRLRIGLAGLALSGLAVRGRGVGRRETSVFRAINGLPDVLLAPAWPLMQAGSLAAVPVSAGVAAACGRPELATRLLAGGLASWTLAKAVKVVYRRPRPRVLVQGARSRGPEARGLGYVSGHAAVATTLTMTLWPRSRPTARAAAAATVAAVGTARIYIGAHLPLDALGGMSLGLAVEAVTDQVFGAAGAACAVEQW